MERLRRFGNRVRGFLLECKAVPHSLAPDTYILKTVTGPALGIEGLI
jgi:hypothetical protein